MARVAGGVGLITCEMAAPERAGRSMDHETESAFELLRLGGYM